MRARIRRRRRASAEAIPALPTTETWLAPSDVAGASAERFSFIACLISAVHCKTHFGQQTTSARDARSSQLPVSGVLTETRLGDL